VSVLENKINDNLTGVPSNISTPSAIYDYYYHYYNNELGLKDLEDRIRARLELTIEKTVVSKCIASIPSIPEGKILDLGCGTGGTALLLADAYKRIVCGLDTYMPAIVISKMRAAVNSKTQVEFCCASANDLPFNDNHFSLISCQQVLEHVDSPKQVLVEMKRVLKPGGFVHITVPSYSSFYEPHYKIHWLPFMGKKRAKLWLKIIRRPTDFVKHINFIQYQQVITIANEAGFKVDHRSRGSAKKRVTQKISILKQSGNLFKLVVAALAERPLFFKLILEWYLLFRVCDHEFVLRT
jgi:ubiquinone/menaquinone biosynthesis C-methylase UbiE